MTKKLQLKWHRSNYLYYALSPINDFVFITSSPPNYRQWSNFIIYKKHLHLLEDFTNNLDVSDLTYNSNRQQSIIDCVSHTFRGAKLEFQTYVNNYHKLEKHSFKFYTLKDYVEEKKRVEKAKR